MPHYDGVVIIADDDFPVIVELEDEQVRLSASGTEIGKWHSDDCEITRVGESTYTIRAENEVLTFVPSQPDSFAAALVGDREPTEAAQPPPETSPAPVQSGAEVEAPAPKPLTMGLFYGLCVVTAALAVWSLISMIF